MSGRTGAGVVGAGLIGTVAAVAVTLGLGGVDAGASDQLVQLAANGENLDSTDLLVIASTNFVDAKDVFTGIDTTDLSGTLLSAVESMHRLPSILDLAVNIVDDRLLPAESAILVQSGSMASLVDQLFLAPLNQQWADTSESMLSASQAFDSAVADGSVSQAFSAELELLGLAFTAVIPNAIASAPVVWIGSLLDDAAATPGLFDFSF